MNRIKILVLYGAKYIGLFWLAKKLTANGLRILCYHGFSFNDEHLFRPKLFMTKHTLAQRLQKIEKMGFSVIGLSDAVKQFQAGKPSANSLVITVDDGWQGVVDVAEPLFKKHDFKWTLYLTTYYAEKQTQVMNVALQYLCWKTVKREYDFSALRTQFNLALEQGLDCHGDKLAMKLSALGNELDTAAERQEFLRAVALALEVNQAEVEENRMFYLIGMGSARTLHDAGVEIQLHTHRHTLGGKNKNAMESEINKNRECILQSTGHDPVHFCFPSGFYEKQHLEWLTECSIDSATTCKPGLNYAGTPLMELKRFLDGENISAIEFEAEMSGFSEILRKCKVLPANYSS